MPVGMRVRFVGRIIRFVIVLMCLVMNMRVRMRDWTVQMFMLVALRHVEPHSKGHQCSRDQERSGDWFTEYDHSDRGAKERSGRKVRARSGSTQMSQRHHKKGEAHAIAEKADHCGRQNR